MDWTKVPDIVAAGLLATAFVSVARRNYTRVSALWFIAWLVIVVHFVSFLLLPVPGILGTIAGFVGLASLAWAGVLFLWASVPYRDEPSSRWMLFVLLATNSIYLFFLQVQAPAWALDTGAVLLGILPLSVALTAIRRFTHPLRACTVLLYLVVSGFLLMVQHLPGDGPALALNGVLFTVYLDCCIHFWYSYRRSTAGAFITIYGFFAWACVFVVGPLKDAYFPSVQLENEVWNLPKFVVAVGMILLLLEEQIEHNKHLALHDPLTGLPNRRLFQDRLASALERARRTGAQAALLVLDLNRFKQVNDTLGHHAGDLLLQHVAKVFNGRVRRSDTVARTGGDEFSVILEAPTSRADAELVGHSLQELLKEPIHLEQRAVRTGASLGIAIFPDDASDMDSLFIAADARMYEEKRAGADTDNRADANLMVSAAPAAPSS